MSYDEFEARQDTIQARVRDLLVRFHECREHYGVLVNYYWYYHDSLMRYIPLEVLRKLTSPESITRAFRKIVSDDPSLAPTPQTQRARDVQLERMRRYHSRDDDYRQLMI